VNLPRTMYIYFGPEAWRSRFDPVWYLC